MILTLALIVAFAAVVIFAVSVSQAPEGAEDESGFKPVPVRYVPAPREISARDLGRSTPPFNFQH